MKGGYKMEITAIKKIVGNYSIVETRPIVYRIWNTDAQTFERCKTTGTIIQDNNYAAIEDIVEDLAAMLASERS